MAYKKEWFNEERFWEEYAPIMFDSQHWAEVPLVADSVTRLAKLNLYDDTILRETNKTAAGPWALDLCCGFGRITLELARRGFAATGVDITQSYLQTAREDAAYEHLDIEFIRMDVRSFSRPQFFDVVTNLYISFGYFENPDDDRQVVQNAYDSLKPGGAFIIETLGKEIAVRDFAEREWFTRAGLTILTEYTPVDSWAGLKNRWILIKEGEWMERTFTQRLYAASELRRLLLDVGFASVELYGDWNDGVYDNRAQMLIAVGRKSLK
ncbi:MAG: class I SAM-dependent methyltransferase [Treponema sp.]|jgi:2-polyprenyl-3-methyl-5-hydroxy-6-metoxy-1,4-benzoquinol methylase|nr:class I SAM-dependent methyltransferase [Treponema sp.]